MVTDGADDSDWVNSSELEVLANNVPTIEDIGGIADQSVTEAGVSYVTFNVTAYDADGVEDLNDTSVNATFSKAGEDARVNLTCMHLGDVDENRANYSCTVGIWYWDGAASLSQLAKDGTSKPGNCKFPEEIESIILTEAIEIIPCTEKAMTSIRGVKAWKK